jgi:signal transduction histidine kinase
MRDVRALVRTHAATVRGDVLLAAVLALGTVPYVAIETGLTSHTWVATLLVVTACGSVGARRRQGVVASAAIAAASLLARLLGQLSIVNDGRVGAVCTLLAIATVFLVSYSVGEREELWSALLGAALLVFAVNVIGTVFNPFASVVALGPWFAGRVVASRRHLNEQLQIRSRELEDERELFARESVRYERTRIARELHDIVAHCVSVMVVQANAGQRLLAKDPSLAIAVFDSISEAAKQAEEEVGRLVDLLGVEAIVSDVSGLGLVQQLVAQAGATGIKITCRFEGSCDGLAPATSDVAFRIVQEGITNALKHAPGAALEIVVRDAGDHVVVEVANGRSLGDSSGLEGSGGGNGLGGMRERVGACGGEVTAGPLPDGGWRILATLPNAAS